jgi:serine/threonine-protein kinase HipA
MFDLRIMIELGGIEKYVGSITGTSHKDAVFAYAPEYLADENSKAISISLPLSERKFDPVRTENFFEGLLPEGFTRRCVAEWLRADERDYIAILAGLGKECLGAIKVVTQGEPEIAADYKLLTSDEVRLLAEEGASKSADIVVKSHLSLTGASGKVGLYFDSQGGKWYQPIGDAPSTHIVKQSHVRLSRIVTNEQICLMTARNLGIATAESFPIMTDAAGSDDLLLATKRYDREFPDADHGSLIDAADLANQTNMSNAGNNVKKPINGLPVPFRLHQEDFAQALGIAAADKYEKNSAGYLAKAFDLLRRYSAQPIEDQLRLWDICVFNYLVGNTDNHIKNISLLYAKDLGTVRLAPAYDLVSTAVYESSSDDMALAIGGEYNLHKITRKSFEEEAKKVGLGTKLAMKHFDEMAEAFPAALSKAKDEAESMGLPGAAEIADLILRRKENVKS